ncbi:MAG: stage III sporulation protein AB [Lachnospiraceae bacterium]|nr:stage III sporulation protein AB [Lachnospiraceae bacterium]
MIIKLTGICLILCSSTAIGFLLSNNLKDRIEELEVVKKFLLMLRGEIKYNHSTLSEAFRMIARRLKPPYGKLLLTVSEEMDSMEGQTLAQIWERCIEKELGESTLRREDREKLTALGGQLGYLDMEMQLGTIELYLEQIQEEIKNARESQKRNGRLYQALGVMAGIFLVILMA